MDLGLYLRVVWRFRLIVFGGFALAVALAFLSLYRVDPGGSPKLAARQESTYQALTTLLVTQAGFPWGRTVLPSSDVVPQQQSQAKVAFADPGRFAQLSVFYAQLANGDAIRAKLRADTGLKGTMLASPSADPTGARGNLPFIDIIATASTAQASARISLHAAEILRDYIGAQQAAAGIKPDERVLLQVVKRPDKPELTAGPKKTTPVLVFLTLMIAAIGLAFVLENLRPGSRCSRAARPSSPGCARPPRPCSPRPKPRRSRPARPREGPAGRDRGDDRDRVVAVAAAVLADKHPAPVAGATRRPDRRARLAPRAAALAPLLASIILVDPLHPDQALHAPAQRCRSSSSRTGSSSRSSPSAGSRRCSSTPACGLAGPAVERRWSASSSSLLISLAREPGPRQRACSAT